MFTLISLALRALAGRNNQEIKRDIEALRKLDPQRRFLINLEASERMMLQRLTVDGNGDPIPGLLETLREGDENLRPPAARLLGELAEYVNASERRKEVIQTLINALHDEPVVVQFYGGFITDLRGALRVNAAEALGRIGDASATLELSEALRNPHPGTRRAAAWALGRIANADAIPALAEALNDPVGDNRDTALSSLKSIGTPDALETIEEWRVRKQSTEKRRDNDHERS